MTLQPAHVDLPIGTVIMIDGTPMRHLGGGQFAPAVIDEPMAKRFGTNDGETLHRLQAA